MKFRYLVFFLINFFFFFAPLKAQNKLGLVLSGGGAKGMAHVGVLKAMEEAGLRPDYIAGTSMGSVVGALYSLGYSADEIETIFRSVDWGEVLSNQVPLDYISFEEKEYYNRYLLELPLVGTKVKFSTGLIRGQMLNELIQRYFWTSMSYQTYDEFPIPFRCIATNSANGEAVVFDRGSLATAVRASMAIPTAFTAVQYDSILLVDGGVVSNFPVEQVLNMGADYVIGVNVGTQKDEPDPESMTEILLSLAMLPSDSRLPEQMKLCDIYIEPDVVDFGTAGFSKADTIIKVGKLTGQEFKSAFEALQRKIGEKKEPFSIAGRVASYKINEIYLDGNEVFSDVLVMNKLGLEAGDSINQGNIEEAIRRVYGINGFKQVDYELVPINDSVVDLNIRMDEKEKTHIFASIHADNLFSAGLTLNITSRDLLGPESRTVLAADISRNPRLRFDYYKYIGQNKRYAANFRYDYLLEQLPIYDKGDDIDIVSSRTNRIALNFISTQSLKQSFSFGLFYESNISKSRYNIDIPKGVDKIHAEQFGLKYAWLKNNFNNRNFPTAGTEHVLLVNMHLENSYAVDLQDGVDTVFLDVEGSVPVGVSKSLLNQVVKEYTPDFYVDFVYNYKSYKQIFKRTQFIPHLSLGLVLGFEDYGSFVHVKNLGGTQRVWVDDIPFLGLNYSEMQEPNYAIIGARIQHLFFKNLFFRYGANLLSHYDYVPLDELDAYLNVDELNNNFLFGYGAELSLRTPLGPLSGGLSWNNKDPYTRYYFSFGYSFNYSD